MKTSKKLITELNRQFQLMGLKKVLNEDWRTQFGVRFINAFRKETLLGVDNSLYTRLMEESINEFNLGPLGIKTIEDLEADLKLHVDQSVSRNTNVQPKIAASILDKIADKMIEKTAKESGVYNRISNMMINIYREVNGYTSGTKGGQLLDDMIELAKRASDDPSKLNDFQSFVEELLRLGIVKDNNISQLIKNVYLKTKVVNSNIGFMGGVKEYFSGLNKLFSKIPGIKLFYKKTWAQAISQSDLQSAFDQIDSLLRQFDESVLEGNNKVGFDVESARLQIANLQKQIAKAEPSAYQFVWSEMKKQLPEKVLQELEKENGRLGYNNVKEWFTYFDKSTDDVSAVRPDVYVGRLQALGRIFNDPIVYKDASRWSWAKRKGERILLEYFAGSARTKEERDLLFKALGNYGKLGYNTSERVMALIFYYPLMGTILQTLWDYAENTGGITNNGKGRKIPLLNITILKDLYLAHGETFSTAGVRKGDNWEAWRQSLWTNFKDRIALPITPSWERFNALSPAIADIRELIKQTPTGDSVDIDLVDKGKNTIIEKQTDVQKELRFLQDSIPELKPYLDELDTLPLTPIGVTQQLITDTTPNNNQ